MQFVAILGLRALCPGIASTASNFGVREFMSRVWSPGFQGSGFSDSCAGLRVKGWDSFRGSCLGLKEGAQAAGSLRGGPWWLEVSRSHTPGR